MILYNVSPLSTIPFIEHDLFSLLFLVLTIIKIIKKLVKKIIIRDPLPTHIGYYQVSYKT